MTIKTWGWTDPRFMYGDPPMKRYEYRAVREQTYFYHGFRAKYAVVRIDNTSMKPYTRTVLYNGLSKEAAEGYCKLLEDSEDE